VRDLPAIFEAHKKIPARVLAALIAVFMLPAMGPAKNKTLVIEYQAFYGPALPDQVATLNSYVEIRLDGHDLYYDWGTRSLLREDCKALKKPDSFTHQSFRCRASRFLITVLPGKHNIGVVLFAGGGIQFSGPRCTRWSCEFNTLAVLEAGKTYDVDFQAPMGSVSGTPTPMYGELTVVERKAEK